MSQHIIFYRQQIAAALANHMLIEHVCSGRANTQCRAQGVLCCRGCKGSVGCRGSAGMQGQGRYVGFCKFVGVGYVCRQGRHTGLVLCGQCYAFVGLCRVGCLQVCVGQGCMQVRQYMVCMVCMDAAMCVWCVWMQQCRLYKRVLVTSMQTTNVFV